MAHVGKCIVGVFQITLINRCITADHLVVIVVHEECGASANLDVCCRRILVVVPSDMDRSFAQNLHFTLDA